MFEFANGKPFLMSAPSLGLKLDNLELFDANNKQMNEKNRIYYKMTKTSTLQETMS